MGFGDRSTGRVIFGGEVGARHCNHGDFTAHVCRLLQRRGPLPKLLWADLFYVPLPLQLRSSNQSYKTHMSLAETAQDRDTVTN